ncbi:MAG: hypothetical protein IK990_13430 [Ruminiclostridium sp.]|nr:hypothetical protein [Ruminiclostridium sp.]
MRENKAFLMFYDYIDQFDLLSDEQLGKLIRMIMDRVNGRGAAADCGDPAVRIMFSIMSSTIEKGNERYEEERRRRSEAAKERERQKKAQSATANHGTAQDSAIKEEEKAEAKEKVKEKAKAKEKAAPAGGSLSDTHKNVFVPPTESEVLTYCYERKSMIDPKKFISYYNANGWRIGNNQMTDWRAAVQLWESRELNQPAPARERADTSYDMSEIERNSMRKYAKLR